MFGAIKDGNTTEALEQAVMASLGINPNEDDKPESTVIRVHATHSIITQKYPELPMDLKWTIKFLKSKFHYNFGSPPEDQKLQLKDSQGTLLTEMVDDDATLQSYGAEKDFTIHVIDTNPQSVLHDLDFDDLSKVEKYVIPDEKYAERTNTFRKFKEE